MFHNLLMTALTPLSKTSEVHQWENKPFTTVWPEQQEKQNEGAETTIVVRRKPKRLRTAYTTEQLKVLEKTYTRFKYIDVERRRELAASLNIGEKSIKVWFQNRRMKEKRVSSESSCDSTTEVSGVISPPIKETKPAYDHSNAPHQVNDNNEPRYELPVFHVQAFPNQYYGQSRVTITPYHDDHRDDLVISEMQTTAFSNEGGVYPTQYYPYSADYNYFEGNNSYNNNAVTSSDYWSHNCFDLSDLQNYY